MMENEGINREGESRTINPPLIAHIIYKLDVGGLENGLVNLINELPISKYRHVIICLTNSTRFRDRITVPGVECYSLNKKPGKDVFLHFRLWRLLRKIRPQVVHTRNLTALEYQMVAYLSGVKCRVHSEHGRDVDDIDGSNIKNILLRKSFRFLIHAYIALSKDLESWLISKIHVDDKRLVQIYNGVDIKKFFPDRKIKSSRVFFPLEFRNPELKIIGCVGRMQPIKNQTFLVRSFIRLLDSDSSLKNRVRLVLVGEGGLLDEIKCLLDDSGMQEYVWLAGEKDNIPEVMNGMDIFVLPSRNEGISNTILEAMSCGLPVIATSVGGNPELIIDGETGKLIPSGSISALVEALGEYLENSDERILHGKSARERCEANFSLECMVRGYMAVYDQLIEDPARISKVKHKLRDIA